MPKKDKADKLPIRSIIFPVRFVDGKAEAFNALSLSLREVSDLQNAVVRHDQNFKLAMLKTMLAYDPSLDRYKTMLDIDFMKGPKKDWPYAWMKVWEEYWGISTAGIGHPAGKDTLEARVMVSDDQFLSFKLNALSQVASDYARSTRSSLTKTEASGIAYTTLKQYLKGSGKKVQALAFGNASYPTFSPVRCNMSLPDNSVKFKYQTWERTYTVSDVSAPQKKTVYAFTFSMRLHGKEYPAYIEVKEDFMDDPYVAQLAKLASGELQFGQCRMSKKSNGKMFISIPVSTPVKDRTKTMVLGKWLSVDLGERNIITGVVRHPNGHLSKPIYYGETREFQNLRTSLNDQMKRKASARQDKRDAYGVRAREKVDNLVKLTAKRLIDDAVYRGFEGVFFEELTGKKLWRTVPVGAVVDQIKAVAEVAGVKMVGVDPKGTSLTCSACGKRPSASDVKKPSAHFYTDYRGVSKPLLFGRYRQYFVCSNPACAEYNRLQDADYNASKNILFRGLEKVSIKA